MKQSFKSFYFNESHDDIPRYCAWCDKSLKAGSDETDPEEKPTPKEQQKGGTHGICKKCLKTHFNENVGPVASNAFPLRQPTFVPTPLSVGSLQPKINPLKNKIKKKRIKKKGEK